MDPKSPLPSSGQKEAAPPTYDESFSHASAIADPFNSSFGAQVRAQLSQLQDRIASNETQKALSAHAKDQMVLTLLTTQIRAYLIEFVDSGLSKGTLVLIPAHSLKNERAEPCDFDNAEAEGNYARLVEVGNKESLDGMRWWKDEQLASRLAGYLRPSPEAPSKSDVAKKSTTTNAGSSISRFWKGKSNTEAVDVSPPEYASSSRQTTAKNRVVMNVEAEEVVYRSENDMGLLETERGYSIVLSLHTTRSR